MKGLNLTAVTTEPTGAKGWKAEMVGVGVSLFFGTSILYLFSLLSRDSAESVE